MKGAATILEMVLISMIVVASVSAAFYWAWPKLQNTLDVGEIKTVKESFALCDAKIVETARTGTTSRCVIPQGRGEVNLQSNGILYTINSQQKVCDLTGWTIIDKVHNVWQKCPNQEEYQLMWYWPKDKNVTGNMTGSISATSIGFYNQLNFMTIDTIVNFETPRILTGSAVEISRVNITEETATLRINMI